MLLSQILKKYSNFQDLIEKYFKIEHPEIKKKHLLEHMGWYKSTASRKISNPNLITPVEIDKLSRFFNMDHGDVVKILLQKL